MFSLVLLILGSSRCLDVDIFLCIFVDSSLVILTPFVNNLCISLFMNNLNMDPSLNLIIKDHVLPSF